MSESDDGTGCAILGAGCLIYLAVGMIVSLVTMIVQVAVGIVLLYLATWLILPLAVLPLADIARRRISRYLHRLDSERSIRESKFPRPAFLQDSRYLDSLVWQFIEWHLGELARNTDLRRVELGLVRRERLLSDPEAFARWRREHLPAALRDPYNREYLVRNLYRELSSALYQVADRPAEHWKAPFLSRLGAKIAASQLPRPRWLLTRSAVYFLSFRLLCIDVEEYWEEPEARDKLLRYMGDSQAFHRFLDRHLFELMGELDPFPFFAAPKTLGQSRQVYRRESEARGHFALSTRWQRRLGADLRAERLKQLRERWKTAREEERQYRAELAQVFEKRAEQLTLEDRRTKFLEGLSVDDLFDDLVAGRSPLWPHIEEVVAESCSWDEEQTREKLARLGQRRPEFREFWEQNEAKILSLYHRRLGYEERRSAEQQEAVATDAQLSEKVWEALRQAASERQLLQQEEHVPVDPKFGLLLARARRRVIARMGDQVGAATEGQLERELRSLLNASDADEAYFSSAVRDRLLACEAFRQGQLAHAQRVRQAGYLPDTDRDELAIAFVEHGQEWRSDYWIKSFHLVLERKHEWQEMIKEVVRGSGERLTEVEAFVDLEPLLPGIEERVRQHLLDKNKKAADTDQQI